MAIKFEEKVAKEAKAMVTTEKTGAVPTEEEIQLAQKIVPKQCPTIGVKLGMTKNLGNYESFRADVSVYVPVDTDNGETLDSCFATAKEWADKKMEALIEEIS